MNITDAIPHRPPFLLVDDIVAVDGHTIRTRRKTDPADPVFSGHFPGNPILPGVLACESIFQSGAILIAHILEGAMENCVTVLTRIANAKFKQIVRPGDTIDMEVHFKEKLGNACYMDGAAKVDGKTVVSIEFACALVALDTMGK
ncbi:MAG TPA: 3-hydroxyacyl-ACP dehydratase FabZ [Planctomycetota bacterium]|nr:3-hydroxyacyl-ACP dehydratase FabZ [Planctomycetota bacterium]